MMKKVIRFLLRIDNLNRILVLSSMVLFFFYPSYILYFTDATNISAEIVIPCLVTLGVVLGTGVFSLYRPIRTTLFYFFEVLAVLLVEFSGLKPDYIGDAINGNIYLTIEVIVCFICIAINLFIFSYYLGGNKAIVAHKEGTNEDTIFDFLNANDSNKKIEKALEKITEQKNGKNYMKMVKKIKFSRLLRTISFGFAEALFLFYLVLEGVKHGSIANRIFSELVFLGSLSTPFAYFLSNMYPKDFKYVYFYNTGLFLLFVIISSKDAGYTPLVSILTIIFLCIAFVMNLIVEGRTWMGASSD